MRRSGRTARQPGTHDGTSFCEAEAAGVGVGVDIDKAPLVAAMRGVYDKALGDKRLKGLAERIRQAQ